MYILWQNICTGSLDNNLKKGKNLGFWNVKIFTKEQCIYLQELPACKSWNIYLFQNNAVAFMNEI